MAEIELSYPEDEAYWQSIYESEVGRPQSWIDAARPLVDAMASLRVPVIALWKASLTNEVGGIMPSARVQGVYLMLAAYAAENLLKALIVSQNRSSLSDTLTSLPKILRTHDLRKLADEAHVTITPTGEELLTRMTHHSIWAGRYSAPLYIEDTKPYVSAVGAKSSVKTWRGVDVRSIDELLDHCAKKLVIASLVDVKSRGYGTDIEPWEGSVSVNDITPWE